MTDYRFAEPLDVLYLRGNRLFGGAGASSTAQMPPWPSIAAGALRSRLLADSGIDLAAFGRGDNRGLSNELAAALGTPATPGSFRITWFGLARQNGTTTEMLLPLPSDVVVSEQQGIAASRATSAAKLTATQLHPQALHAAISSSLDVDTAPILFSQAPSKAVPGCWLNQAGIEVWLRGEPIDGQAHLLRQSELWATDSRLGIALDGDTRSAADGMLYTSDTIALHRQVGFLMGVDGAAGLLPDEGLLRFGGDGRATHVRPAVPALAEPDWQRIASEKRLRIVLVTPGLFDDGWRLPGSFRDGDRWMWRGNGIRARLVCAAVSRTETVSGWDLAQRAPKPAMKTAPIGSVYWLDDIEGDVAGLRELLNEGLWPLIPQPDRSRQAEGFNRILLAPWARAAQ